MHAIDLTCDDVREMAGAFVLGALEPAEEAAVRDHLATCRDAHAEIAELGSVLPVLLESVPVVEPPAALKGRIMAAAAADLEARSTPPAAAPAAAAATAGLAPASTVSEPIAVPGRGGTHRARRRGLPRRAPPRRSPGSCGSRRSSRSWRSAAGTCCCRTSSTAPSSTSSDVAAVLELAAKDGSMTAVLRPAETSGPPGSRR